MFNFKSHQKTKIMAGGSVQFKEKRIYGRQQVILSSPTLMQTTLGFEATDVKERMCYKGDRQSTTGHFWLTKCDL